MIRDYRDHSANERTFLAWVRTGIAIIAFGFVVERFNVFLVTLASASLSEASQHGRLSALTRQLGRYDALVLILSGLALVVLASVRFARTTRLLDDGQTHAMSSVRTELILSAALVLLVSTYTVYLAVS
jgi:putative membrane protein